MASRRVKRVSLFSDLEKAKLEQANIITLSDFISTPFDQLRVILDLGYYSLNELIANVSEIIAPKPKDVSSTFNFYSIIVSLFTQAWTLLQSQSHFMTSFEEFDKALHGGLPYQTVTEIAGPESSGKTELVLQWTVYNSLSKQFGGLEKGTLFLSSDGPFSAQRLFYFLTYSKF